MNFSFSNLKGISIFFAVCVLISVIPPGLLFIHMFIPDLASTYNFGYVLILSISIAGPPWLINSFLSTLVSSEDNNSQRNSDQKKDEKEDKEEEDDDISETAGMGAVFGSLYNLVLFYIPLLIKFFFDTNLKWGVIFLLTIEVIIIVFTSSMISLSSKNQ